MGWFGGDDRKLRQGSDSLRETLETTSDSNARDCKRSLLHQNVPKAFHPTPTILFSARRQAEGPAEWNVSDSEDDCTVSSFGGFLEELNRKHRPALTSYLSEDSNKASEQPDGVTLIFNPTSLLGKEYEAFYPRSEFMATLGEFVNNSPVTVAHQCLTPERSQLLVTMAKLSSTDAVSVTLNSGLRSDAAISMKKELLRRCLSITAQKMASSEADLLSDQLRAYIKNEAAALLRQTREIGYGDSNGLSEHETKALLAAIYKRAREKILVLPWNFMSTFCDKYTESKKSLKTEQKC